MTNYLVEHWMELYKSAFAWSRLWKRAAKKWYRVALSWQAWGEAHEALADKRLVLLKAANKDRVQQGSRCSHCKKLPKVISIWHGDYKFKDVHTDDCELAEAIAEE